MAKRYAHFYHTDDGDWYLIPDDERDLFLACLDRIEAGWNAEELADWFKVYEEKFKNFRLSGGVESYAVLISE